MKRKIGDLVNILAKNFNYFIVTFTKLLRNALKNALCTKKSERNSHHEIKTS